MMNKIIAFLFISVLVFNSCENQFVASENAEVQKESKVEISKSVIQPDEPIYIVDGVIIPLEEAKEIIATKIRSIQVQKGESGNSNVIKIELKAEEVKKTNRAFKVTINQSPAERISEKPIYIVDGVVISANELRTIDESTIKSINVQKGGKALEKYGASGKNGVVEIKLKE